MRRCWRSVGNIELWPLAVITAHSRPSCCERPVRSKHCGTITDRSWTCPIVLSAPVAPLELADLTVLASRVSANRRSWPHSAVRESRLSGSSVTNAHPAIRGRGQRHSLRALPILVDRATLDASARDRAEPQSQLPERLLMAGRTGTVAQASECSPAILWRRRCCTALTAVYYLPRRLRYSGISAQLLMTQRPPPPSRRPPAIRGSTDSSTFGLGNGA